MGNSKTMKQIKIFSLPSHQTKERTSGVDFVRIIQPMKYLNGYTTGEYTFKVDMFDINEINQSGWDKISQEYDIVYLNYTVLDVQYAIMGCLVHGRNKKIVMDLDDAMWYLGKDNIVYDSIKELDGTYKLTCMLNDVDLITTTNRYLKNVITKNTNRYQDAIKVFPNYIDLSLYNHISPFKNNGQITLLHFGSTSHFEDLKNKDFLDGIDKIFYEYPNVKIKFIGAFLSELKNKWGIRCEHDFGDVDIYKWAQNKFPQYIDEADIIVVPLNDNIYNRCKSDIKFLEISSAKKVGIFSGTRPYLDTIEHGKTGFIANSGQDWYTYLKLLIDNAEKRREIGENAYHFIKENRQIQNHLQDYAEMFIQLLS